MDDQLSQAALDYHRYPQPGKIAVATPTKGMSNQRDLALTLQLAVAWSTQRPARRQRRRSTGEREHRAFGKYGLGRKTFRARIVLAQADSIGIRGNP